MQTASQPDPVPPAGIPAVQLDKPKEQPSAAEGPEQRDLFARAQRRKLPDERKSITHKFSVGGHEGYIIPGMYAEGAPGELFIKMAKEGSTLSGFMDGLALSISPSGFTENPSIRHATSVLDYIARWLGGKFLSPEYLKPRAAVSEQELVIQTVTRPPFANTKEPESIPPGKGSTTVGDAPSCSTCGMLMVPNGSCYKCVNCGSTSGCS